MISDDRIAGKLIRHFRILGVCWVLYGILCMITAVWLILFTNTATLMFGALLNRVPDPFSMMNIFHFIYGLQIAWKGQLEFLGSWLDWVLSPGVGLQKPSLLLRHFFLFRVFRLAQPWEFIVLSCC